MTRFDNKIRKLSFESNVVVRVGSLFFSQKRPDSGVTVPDEHIGLVLDASMSPVQLEITKAKTSVSSMNFSLLDKDALITNYLIKDPSAWINKEVFVWVGVVNCSCSFSAYKLLKKARIKSYTKGASSYNFTTYDPTADLITPIFTRFSTLVSDIDDDETSIEVLSTDGFPSEGTLNLGSEFVTYTGITGNTFTGVTRGVDGSEPSTHSEGTECYRVFFRQDHSMNIALDVLKNELSLDDDLIIEPMFTGLRDNQLSVDSDFRFALFNIPNALSWLEQEILLPTNTRFVIIGGRIGITMLDENTTPSAAVGESQIRGTPGYQVDGNRIINLIYAKYNYSHGRDKFLRTDIFRNEDSIGFYGERPFTLEYRGLDSTLGGSDTIKNRSERLLSKLAFPIATLNINTHLTTYGVQPSQIIQVSHRYLPARGRGIGMNDVLEVTSVGLRNLKDDPQVIIRCEYTSFGVYRSGLISPSPMPTNIISQKVFEVPDGTMYKPGYVLRLWDSVNYEFYDTQFNEVESIDGNQLTMVDNFDQTLNSDVRVFFAPYDECSEDQREIYAFISAEENRFLFDDTDAYRIVF